MLGRSPLRLAVQLCTYFMKDVQTLGKVQRKSEIKTDNACNA